MVVRDGHTARGHLLPRLIETRNYEALRQAAHVGESRHETQKILEGGEAATVPDNKVTLFLLRTKDDRTRNAAWWPQVRFPDGRYAFAFTV